MQTACCWQLFVFRSFYGSSEPDTPSHNDPIPSKPVRPLSVKRTLSGHAERLGPATIVSVCDASWMPAGTVRFRPLHRGQTQCSNKSVSVRMENTAVAPVAAPSTRDIEDEIHEPL